MAQNRSSQRGVIQAASTIVLAAFTALLSMTGCSADTDPEAVGTVSEAIGGICPKCKAATLCRAYTCSDATNYQCVAVDKVDLTDCSDANGPGVCTAGLCCRGCYRPGRVKGEYTCQPISGTDCGLPGGKCLTAACSLSTDPCVADVCNANGACDVAKIDDGGACNQGQPGACYKGSCCSGCINSKGICQAGNQPDSCGLTGPNNLVQCKTCVDGDPCTSDVCDQTGACTNPVGNENGSCSDGNACNGAETCQGGTCVKPTNFSCPTDTNPCHAPTCDPVKGCDQQLLTGTGCTDNNVCNGKDTCSNGVCQPGATIKNCDDGNPCTVDSCDPKNDCQHVQLEAGSSCDNDKDVCNGSAVCDANAQCTAVPAPKCDDGNVCTDDKCDPVKGCFKVNNTAPCSDNNLCTTNDKCSGGACVGGTAPSCDDGEECTTDTCDPAVGCVRSPVKPGTICSDNNMCTTIDLCDKNGKCVGTGGPSCEDDNPCTQNYCDAVNGQKCSNPAEKDGTTCALDKCHQNTTCTGGKCGGGIAISCDDSNPCTIDSCDAAMGCKHDPDPKGVCSDGDVCTTGDACVNGECKGKAMACTPIDDCHVAGTCNAKTGQCDDPRADDDTACDSGDGTCKTGKCIPNPGAGGAGGETGVGGEGTSGSGVTQGGKPPVTGAGGEGNETATGGTSETGGKNGGGKGGKSSGAGTTSQDGGAADVPEHVFVREPGGCSCRLPGGENSQDSRNSKDFAWLGALGLAALVAARRRKPSASKPRILS